MPSVLDTPATSTPIDLDAAKEHLNLDTTDDDAYVLSLIGAATKHIETITNRALISQTWSQYLDAFDDEIELSRSPLSSVVAITYTDTDGATQTAATSLYDVDTVSTPGRVLLAYGKSWPDTRSVRNAVRIQYVAGYGDAGDVPQPIKQAMKILIGHWYEHREPVIAGTIVSSVPMSVDSLLMPYRVVFM